MIAPTDWITVNRVSALGGVDLVQATFVTRATPRHSHAEFEIGVVGSGRRLVWCRGRHQVAPAGSILIFHPGEIHAGSPVDETGSTYRSFLVSAAALRPARAWSAAGPPRFLSPIIRNDVLAGRLADAHRTLGSDGPDAEPILLAALDDLARWHRAAPGPEPAPREHAAIQRVRDYLEAHYATRIQLKTLATVAGLSVFHLIRVFRDATGLPPYAYLEQIRVGRAAELLREGCPVSQVAFRTGFADQSHLSRFFKRLIGVPPGQYQRSARKWALRPECSHKIVQAGDRRIG